MKNESKYITINDLEYKLPNGLKSEIRKDNVCMITCYEPYFKKFVWCATIRNNPSQYIKPTHGYFSPHLEGQKLQAWCKKNGVEFNNN